MKLSYFGILSALVISVAAIAGANDTINNAANSVDNGAKDAYNSAKNGVQNAISPAKQEAGQASDAANTNMKDFKDNDQAKMSVGPHSIMIESSLLSTQARVEGLRSQLKLVKNQAPNSEFLEHAKAYNKDIGSDLRTAKQHDAELKASLQNYPMVANSDNAKNLQSAIGDLDSFYVSWNTKAKDAGYWQNTTQASNDLEALSGKIDNAISQSKTFNSDELSVSVG